MSIATPTATALLPSSQRPIPLQLRADVQIETITFRSLRSWVVKDPVRLKYHRLRSEQHFVLKQLDGQQSLNGIRRKLQKQFPQQQILLSDVQQIITALCDLGLVTSLKPGHAASRLEQHKTRRRKERLNALKNLLFIRLPGWDPEKSLTLLYPWFRWAFHPLAVVIMVAFVAAVSFYSLVQIEEFYRQLPAFRQFFGWPNWLYLWLTLGVAKLLHEFGHGLACKHYGGECHEMGLMFLVFSPCLYCDVTDSWMLKNKWQRIAIAAAGMYVEVFLSALALTVWWWTRPGLVHHLALNVFFVTSLTTVIFNINPLMRYDGYYILADWLEIPNLRPQADKHVRELMGKALFGIEAPFDPFAPQGRRWGFLLYAFLATVYRWLILASILFFLYTVLKPYNLQSIGIGLAIVSVVSMLGSWVSNFQKMLSAPRDEPMKHGRWITALAVAVLAIVGIGMIPVPWHLHAPFLVEPVGGQPVYVTTPGQLTAIHVKPGSRVEQGERLLSLANLELADRLHQLKIDERQQQSQIDLYFALRDVGREEIAREMYESTRRERAELERRMAQLEIVAPISGRVIAAPRIAEPTYESRRTSLSLWQGRPLDAENVGCYLEEQTQLLSVAPTADYQAVLMIDQADRNEIEVGQTVELKLENRPGLVLVGQVKQISDHHSDIAPLALSVKTGSVLPTVTDGQGRERLTGTRYQAIVSFDPVVESNSTQNTTAVSMPRMLTGLRGEARFLVEQHSLGTWLWRWLRQLFHFRL